MFAGWSLVAQVAPQKTNDPQAAAIELLRRTIAEQQSHPNQIIRTPTGATRTNAATASAGNPELERQYLEGKLTAKQYQKALEQWRQEQQKRSATAPEKPRALQASREQSAATPAPPKAKPPLKRTTDPRSAAAAVAPSPVASPASTQASAPASPTVSPEPTQQQKKLSEVEARIDEMLRLKAVREKAAVSNAVALTNNAAAAPQTKRQRLDALLKQYLEGTLTDAEYNQRRAKIIAEAE